LLLSLIAVVYGQQRDGPFYFIDEITPLGKIPIYKGSQKFLLNFEKIREENTWMKVDNFTSSYFGWETAVYSTYRDYNCIYQGFQQTLKFNDTVVSIDGSFRLMETDYKFGSVSGVAGDIVFEFNVKDWPFVKTTNTLWTRLKFYINDVANNATFCTFKSGTNPKLFYNIEDGEDVYMIGYVDELYSSSMQVDFRFPSFTSTLKHMTILRLKTTCDQSISSWNYTGDLLNRTESENGTSTDTGSDSGTDTGSTGTDSGATGTDSGSDSGTDPVSDNENDQASNSAFTVTDVSMLSLCIATLFLLF